MKYIAVLVVIIMFVRIDVLLGLFDKASNSFKPAPPEVQPGDINTNRELIPVSEDRNLKQTPKENFFALLEVFRISPEASIRERAMGIFKDHPAMFNDKLDVTLESLVYRWREHLNNNEPETVNFLIDLMSFLKGENLEMVKKFFALWMEIDMENFIAAYSKTRDTNCSIATTFGDRIPEEEKIKELYDREDALKALVAKEKLNPLHRALAKNCLLVIGLEINKNNTDTNQVTPQIQVPSESTPVSVEPPSEGSTP